MRTIVRKAANSGLSVALSLLAGLSLAVVSAAGDANANPPIEAYGNLPSARAMTLSPSGDKYAYLARTNEGENTLMIVDVAKKAVTLGSTGAHKTRRLSFIDDRYLSVDASATTRYFSSGKFEFSASVILDTNDNEYRQLLKGTSGLYPAQSGLAGYIGVYPEKDAVFVPAFMGDSRDSGPAFSLLWAPLNTGRGRVYSKGNSETRDWMVSREGVIFAREDRYDKSNKYRLLTKVTGKWETLYETTSDLYPFTLVGVTPDHDGLVLLKTSAYDFIDVLTFDGKQSRLALRETERDIYSFLTDQNRTVLGLRYAGLMPSYEFFDPALDADIQSLQSNMQGLAIDVLDISDDKQKVLAKISGSEFAPAYFLFDREKGHLGRLGNAYDQIKDGDVGAIFEITYKARDGHKIPAIVTAPPGEMLGDRTLPLIVLPHGGPESHDAVGFDWMAQYFANRGYLVLQPNFRGSSGFGRHHVEAAYGEWGGIMQDDVTDGVAAFIRQKWADPERICIVGASYGGYAALAGGAFTPDLYKCVAAIAPVSDLALMLAGVQSDSSEGTNSIAYKYWTRFIGDRREDKEKLEAVSPAKHAAAFKAPVLLIHGINDTIVPYRQSRVMESALKKAGKRVKLVRQKKEDHWLSLSESRLQALQEIAAFVEETIGDN
ncbi:MAG: alpha/beta fold hydrolase [Pseudomonadota bacterium]